MHPMDGQQHPIYPSFVLNQTDTIDADDPTETSAGRRRMSTISQWRGSGSLRGSRNSIVAPLSALDASVVLGPGQIQPKGYRLAVERYGELKLGLTKVKGVVEVEVSDCIVVNSSMAYI